MTVLNKRIASGLGLGAAFLLAATWGTHFFCYHRQLEQRTDLLASKQPEHSSAQDHNPTAIASH